MARARATAAYRPGASTVTTLMMVPAVCALTMLADLRHAAWLAAAAKVTGSGNWPLSRATGPATMLSVTTVCFETI
jgi:hypothetical protein